MVKSIEYRDEAGEVVAAMRVLPDAMTIDAASVVAQKYMRQFGTIATAHVFATDDRGGVWAGGSETVISAATEWQKRNG